MENKINQFKSKIKKEALRYDAKEKYPENEIEAAYPISQNQLNNAKLFSSREDYAQILNKKISYLEVGVAWGHSAKMFIDTTNAKSADLLDLYDGANNIVGVGGVVPENILTTHEEYIKNKFSYHPCVNTIKGDAKNIVPTLNKKYDFIFFDMDTERFLLKNLLLHCSELINIGGVIGLTSYINYDSINYGKHIGTYNSVNEFLNFNHNWSVDGIVLQQFGFHDIYIKKNSEKK
jgi:hypothetical protein